MLLRPAVIAALASAQLAACAPLARPFYVGDASAGRLVFNSCSLGAIPEGLEASRAGIVLLVSMRPWREGEVVHARYDIVKGHRTQLADRELVVDPRDGSAPRIAVNDAIGLWDQEPDAGYAAMPARRDGLRPPDLPMDDSPLPPLPTGPRSDLPAWHCEVAAHLGTAHADRVWGKMPDLSIDCARLALPEIRFDRQFGWFIAPLNF